MIVLRLDSSGGMDSCWPWLGYVRRDGYGALTANGQRGQRAHKVVYEHFVGPVPTGLELDHTCRNRSCVNPRHLEPVTKVENILRGDGPPAQNARKLCCIHGHPFTPENTQVRPSGKRECLTCKREWMRRYRSRMVASGEAA